MNCLGAVLALYAVATTVLGPDIRRFPPDLIGAEAMVVGGVRITAALESIERRRSV